MTPAERDILLRSVRRAYRQHDCQGGGVMFGVDEIIDDMLRQRDAHAAAATEALVEYCRHSAEALQLTMKIMQERVSRIPVPIAFRPPQG